MKSRADRFNAALGKQIRAEIAAAGMSISSVARDMDIARSALDNYVTGKRAIPVPVAYRIGEIVGLDAQVIVQRAQERFDLEEREAPANVIAGRFGSVSEAADSLGAVAKRKGRDRGGDEGDE